METYEHTPVQADYSDGIKVTPEAIADLNATRKWTLFLTIIGFVGLGFLVLAAFAIGTIFSAMGMSQGELPIPGFLFTVIYLFFAAIWFFPLLYLFRFSTWMKSAVENSDQLDLGLAFKNLKAHYRFVGILMIVLVSFYALIFIVTIIGGLAAGF